MPTAADLDLDGLDVDAADVDEALAVNADEWREELPLIEEWFEFVGEKLPTGIKDEFDALKHRLAEEPPNSAEQPQQSPEVHRISGGFSVLVGTASASSLSD